MEVNPIHSLKGVVMGRAARHLPKKLPTKLRQIRKRLGVQTFEEWIVKLDLKEVKLYRASIQQYERGLREPPLIVLLRYAQLANVRLDVLVDDDLELPE
jgi:transcriptional regulator with XRE-family HTH domain